MDQKLTEMFFYFVKNKTTKFIPHGDFVSEYVKDKQIHKGDWLLKKNLPQEPST